MSHIRQWYRNIITFLYQKLSQDQQQSHQEVGLQTSDALLLSQVNFYDIANRIFREDKGTLYIGEIVMSEETRSQLRDEAQMIGRTYFWEIFSATLLNEAANISLIQSTDWNHIVTAKMLHHWVHVMRSMIKTLSK